MVTVTISSRVQTTVRAEPGPGQAIEFVQYPVAG